MQLLIIDDHPVFREGFAAIVQLHWPACGLLQAGTREEALRLAYAAAVLDLVVLDLVLPDGEALGLIRELGALHPGAPVLVLTASEDAGDLRRALAAGAAGYVPKSAAPGTLASAIRLVLAGDIYVSPLAVAQSATAGPVAGLTLRQMEVLRVMAGGASNKDIARGLGLSEKTVKAHLVRMFRALGVQNRTQAVAAARLAGLL